MSWLAGETKWWLVAAALLGFALTWLFLLRRVQVRESVAGSARASGGIGAKVAAGAGAAGAGAVAAGAAVNDKVGPDKPSFDKPAADLDKPAVDADLPTSDPTTDAPTVVDAPATDAPPADAPEMGTGTAVAGAAGTAVVGSAVGSSDEIDAATIRREPGSQAAGSSGNGTAEASSGSHRLAGPSRPAESSFGPGTAEALADGGSPHPDYLVKGNADSMKFHTIESPYYGRTRAEVWFDSEESARKAGFRHWKD